jgi:hypothetical protein
MYEATAPQSIGGVLDSGFSLFRSAFKSTFLIAFAAAFLAAPAGRLAQSAVVGGAPGGLFVIAAVIGFVLYMIVTLTLYAAVLVLVDKLARGEATGIGAALSLGLRRGAALFGFMFFYSLAAGVGTMLLFVPGIWVMVAMFFGGFAVVLDGKGPIAGLGYSMRLVRGHWWRTTGILTVIFFIYLVVYLIIGVIAGAAAVFQTDTVIQTGNLPWYIDFIVVPVLSAVVLPLLATMTYAVYRDLKLRSEGTDLADRIAAAAQ